MLASILRTELSNRNLSSRKAAKESGVAHTTIIRIIEGKNVDFETVKTVCKWLKIEVSDVLSSDNPDKNSVAPIIATFLDKNPRLKVEFIDAISKLQCGEIDSRVIEEILLYITFRIKMSAKTS